MKKTRYILVQALIEVDVTNVSDFNENYATSLFNSALHLGSAGKAEDVKVHILAGKPGSVSDIVVEEYEYRDFQIQMEQNAHTIGSEQPTYFAVVTNMQAKTPTGSLVGSDSESIELLKKLAEEYVDKRKMRMEKLAKAKPKT